VPGSPDDSTRERNPTTLPQVLSGVAEKTARPARPALSLRSRSTFASESTVRRRRRALGGFGRPGPVSFLFALLYHCRHASRLGDSPRPRTPEHASQTPASGAAPQRAIVPAPSKGAVGTERSSTHSRAALVTLPVPSKTHRRPRRSLSRASISDKLTSPMPR